MMSFLACTSRVILKPKPIFKCIHYNKSNSECGIIPEQMHLHGITFTTWKKLSISCKGYNVNLQTAVVCCKMPQTNSIRSLSGIKVLSKCEINPPSGFKSTAFTSNILHRVQC